MGNKTMATQREVTNALTTEMEMMPTVDENGENKSKSKENVKRRMLVGATYT